MSDALRDLFFGSRRRLVETVAPRRTFDDVVLPPPTLEAIRHALALIRKQDLIFEQWGLAERHGGGLGLAFHFAGPPGTGKTIAAEAIAATLGRELLVVRYAELESRWAGQTAKHVAAVFRDAAETGAVLFFDEADAIAGRRFTNLSQGYERDSNATVAVLLNELERFPGVVIFAPTWPPTSIRRSSAGFATTSGSRCRARPSASASGGRSCTRPRRRSPPT
jgi:ATPases of the AAA+ class